MSRRVLVDESDGVVTITPPSDGTPVGIRLHAGQMVRLARDGALVVTPAPEPAPGQLRIASSARGGKAHASVLEMARYEESRVEAALRSIAGAPEGPLSLREAAPHAKRIDGYSIVRVASPDLGLDPIEIRDAEGRTVWRGEWRTVDGARLWHERWTEKGPDWY